MAARQEPLQACSGSLKLSIGWPSPRRQEATDPLLAVSRVPVPAPFQVVMAAMTAVAPPSTSVIVELPRLSTMTLGGLLQVRRGESRT